MMAAVITLDHYVVKIEIETFLHFKSKSTFFTNITEICQGIAAMTL